jgi:cell division protein FtsB
MDTTVEFAEKESERGIILMQGAVFVPPSHTTSRNTNKASISSRSIVRSRRKPWLRLRYVLLVVVCGWAGIHYFTVQYPEWKALEVQNVQLNHQLSQLNQQQTELHQQVQQLNSKAYIEKYATEHFDLILPGQVSFNMAH